MIERTVRRAQAIHPYGPGAILDWGQECFVVLDTSARTTGWRRAPRIELPRLQQRLRAKDGFRLPPARSGGLQPDTGHLTVQRFPSWLFCPRCRLLWRWGRQKEIQAEFGVPRCGNAPCAKKHVALVPMRFVAACAYGHLADVDWFRWAHSSSKSPRGSCDRRIAELELVSRSNRGATLEAQRVRCRTCGSPGRSHRELLVRGALGRVGQRCHGRQPWQPRDEEKGCDQSLWVLQRSATAIHFSETVSALDIRNVAGSTSPRERILEKVVRDQLEYWSPGELLTKASRMGQRATELLHNEYPEAPAFSAIEVEEFLRRLEEEDGSEDELNEDSTEPRRSQLLREEWPILTSESECRDSRVPIVVREEPLGRSSYSADLRSFIDGVFLVDRLREVRVFEGFRRVDASGKLVYPNLGETPPTWLPAMEVFGEGLFLRISQKGLDEWEESERARIAARLRDLDASLAEQDAFKLRFADRRRVLARFVLVHTFSHLLVRQLCYECGYSSASLRERLYVFPDRAGLLIYTADGDSEGSLGGLVRQGRSDRLVSTVVAALERGSWCSNDPICRELPVHGPGKTNRAACHACCLASETSCTELNALLDRTLVVGEPGPSSPAGFFKRLLDDSREDIRSGDS